MTLNANLVRAYQNGEVSVSAYGASPALPTDATTPLDSNLYTGIGLNPDSGIVESNSQDWKKIYAWQNGALIATLPGPLEKQIKVIALQQTLTNLGLQYPGSTITQTAYGVSIDEKAPTIDKRVWIVHGIAAGGVQQRVVCPSGQITDRGDVAWTFEDLTAYEWTVELFPDSNLSYTKRYIVDPALAL